MFVFLAKTQTNISKLRLSRSKTIKIRENCNIKKLKHNEQAKGISLSINKTVGRAGRTNSKAKKKPRSQLIKKKQEVSLSLYQDNGKLSKKCQYSFPFNVILYFLLFYFTSVKSVK